MIELLEARIAPAALNGNVLTYKDTDGDFVRVVFTHAAMAAGDFTFSTGTVDGTTTTAQALSSITLSGKTGAGFTLTATQLAGQGDSHANIGTITSTSTALGAIVIDGDLASANFTAPNATTASLKSLTVLSLGKASGNGTDTVNITGIKVLNVRTDIANVSVSLNPCSVVTASLNIGGSLIGGTLADSAYVSAVSPVLFAHVGGDLHGGSGISSGTLNLGGTGLRSLTIGGSVRGGSNTDTGTLLLSASTTASVISIAGDLKAGSADDTGFINMLGAAVLRIGGSIIGSGASQAGAIFSGNSIGALVVGHNVAGGDNSTANPLTQSGYVYINGNLGTLIVGGELVAGEKLSTGAVTEDGWIGLSGVLTRAVLGGIEGNANVLSYLAAGGAGATTGMKLGIGSLTVVHSVTYGSILAGYDTNFTQKNADAGIGTVAIGGNLASSFITTGTQPGNDNTPGTADDNNTGSLAVIESVRIGGAFTGAATSMSTYFIFGGTFNQLIIGHAVYQHAALESGRAFNTIGFATAESAH